VISEDVRGGRVSSRPSFVNEVHDASVRREDTMSDTHPGRLTAFHGLAAKTGV